MPGLTPIGGQMAAMGTLGERFAGRTVLVTGAGSGIGKATADRVLAEGGAVVGFDLTNAGEASDRYEPATGDVRDHDAIRTAVARAVERFGRLDGLVNSAGTPGGGPVHLVPGGGMGAGRVDQPHRHLPRRQARHRADAAPGPRRRRAGLDRHHRERRRPRGHRRWQLVQRVQGRGRAAHQEHGDRLRPPGDPGRTRCAPASSTRRCCDGVFDMEGMERGARRHRSTSTSCDGGAGPRRSPRWWRSSCRPTPRS